MVVVAMMVAKALVAVAVEVAMAVADMPAVDLAAADMATAEFDSAAVDMAAAFARKRGVADDYCEREKQCYGRCTHSFMLHPPGCQRVNQLVTSGRYFGCCRTIRPPRLMGRRHPDSALGMASSEGRA
jgi:hypothetical protein